MKKRLIAALCAGVVAVTAVTGAVIYSNNYDVYTIVETAGVAVAGDDMLLNLTGEKVNTENEEVQELESAAFEASETVYVRGGKLYLGENKVPLSSAYPFFVNGGTAVYCINGNTTAITEDFDYVSTYEGLYISDGISFNQDMERAYREDFLMLQLSNGLFLNSMELTLKKSDLPGENLPGNSVISFFENELRYYTLGKDGIFRLSSVQGLTEESKIIINNVSYPYYDFLDRLGIYEVVEEVVEITPEPTPTPTPIPTPTPAYKDRATNTPAPTNTPKPTQASSQEDNMGNGAEAPPEVYPSPGEGAAQGSVIPPTPQPKPTKVPTEKERITPTPRPTLTPIPPMTAAPAEPGGSVEPAPGAEGSSPAAPAPAEPAPPAGAAPPAQPSPSKPSSPGATLWKKPEAELSGDFTALVYSVTHNSLKVTNAQFLHKSGIAFEVKDSETGKLVGRKAYADSTNDIRISGLEPDTKYKVTVTMNYVDAKGNKVSEVLREGDIVTTYGRDKLPLLDINWSNGEYLYVDKADLKAIQFENRKENDPFYQDMIQHITKAGIQFKQGFSKDVFVLNQQNLTELKNGKVVDYTTPERLKSNKEYTYTFSFTDKFGEEFRMVGTYQGTIRTAKKAPLATIKVTKNEVKDIELEIRLVNSDDAVMENTYFIVTNSAGTPLETTIYRDRKKTPETSVRHTLTKESTNVRFAELLDAESYLIEVYSNYDQADNHGMVLEQLIGSGKVITTSITSLGAATYNVSFLDVKSDGAIAYVKLDKSRTSSRLYGVIDQYDILFEKITRDANGEVISASPADIRVDYIANETAVEETPEEEEDVNIDDISLYGDDLDTLGTIEENADPMENKKSFVAEDGKLTLESYQLDMIHGDGMSFVLSDLDSVSEYRITITPKVHVGSVSAGVVRKIRSNYAPNSFITLKREAYITMDSARVTSNSIKLFKVAVVDKDNAILEYPLNVQVYDEQGTMVFREIYSEERLTGGNSIDIELLYLNNNQEYTVRFTVPRYKEDLNSTDYVTNYELYYDPFKEAKEPLVLTTGDAITGDIYLKEITTGKVAGSRELKVGLGNDGFKIHAVQKHPDLAYSRTYGDINKVYINTRNPNTEFEFLRYRYEHTATTELWAMVFKAEVDFGEDYYNAMSIGYGSVDPTTVGLRLYQEDPSANPNAKPLAETEKQSYNVTADNFYLKWMDAVTFRDGIELTGKQTLYVEYVCLDEVLEPGPGQTDKDIENWGDLGVFGGVTFSKRMEVEDRNQYFYANVEVEVLDLAGQLGEEGSYFVQIYEDDRFIDMQKHVFTNRAVNGKKQVSIYDVTSSNDPNPVLLETIYYEGEGLLCHFNYYYKIKRNGVAGHEYKFKLTAYPDNPGNEMDILTFMSDKMATGIRSREELKYLAWDPYGSYVVLEDIDLKDWYYSQTGMSSIYFEGNLDFQGHTLIVNDTRPIINYLGSEGVIENVVIKTGETFKGYSTNGMLVYQSYGTIRNVMVEACPDTLGCRIKNGNVNSNNHAGLVYQNLVGSLIENFVIHLPEKFYCTSYSGQVAYMNYGTIRNGYVYGAPMSIVPYEYLSDTQKTAREIYIAPICPNNRPGSLLENVYSLVDVYCTLEKYTANANTRHISLLCRESGGMVKNCFAVGSCYYVDQNDTSKYIILPTNNPLIYAADATKHTELYFYSKENYDATNVNIGKHMIDLTILHSDAWMENLLNNEVTSKSGQFDTSHVRHGYYPQLNLPSNMPAQPLLTIPEIGNTAKAAVLSATVLPETESLAAGTVQALLQVYLPEGVRPDEYRVTSVEADNVDVRVVSYHKPSDQYYWEVVVELSNPAKCVSKYPVKKVVLESDTGAPVEITDDDKTCKYINYAFYHPIRTLEDWYKINNARGENYRLYNDLDFANADMSKAYIGNKTSPNKGSTVPGIDNTYNFAGVLDGNGYSIQNLDLRDYGGLFETVYGGTIKNLTIENLDISAKDADAPVDRVCGFVRYISKNGKLDNVHVLGGKLTSTYVTGTLVGKVIGENRYGEILNCSVHDVTITTTAKDNVNQQYVGGIIGQGTSKTTLILQNCYVDGLEIIAKDAFTIGGIGGMAGELFAGCTLENLYVVDSSIDSYYKNIAGVVASLKTADNNYTSTYILRKVYADIDITSTSDVLGGLVGYTTCTNVVDVVNGLFLGNVVVTNEAVEYINRYDGGGKSVRSRARNLYTLGATSFVNGWLNEDVDAKMEAALEKLYADEEDVTITVIPDIYTGIDKEILSEPSFYSTGVFLNGEWRNLNFVDGFTTDYETVDGAGNPVETALVADGYLPWLKTTDGMGILPYQKKHAIDETDVRIEKTTATAFANNNMMYQLNITVTHPEGTVIDGVVFDENLQVRGAVRKVEHSATETELIYDVTALHYKDRFFIRELCYHTPEGQAASTELYLDTNVPALFKNIKNAAEWDEHMSSYGMVGENIRLTGDLDFSGATSYNHSNVIINQLVGGVAGKKATISGITDDETMISKVLGRIYNVEFKDIELTRWAETETDVAALDIETCFGIVEQVIGSVQEFALNDISIKTAKVVRVAPFVVVNSMVKDGTVDGVFVHTKSRDITGVSNELLATGGVAAYATKNARFENLTLTNFGVDATGRWYNGGVTGRMDGAVYFKNIDMENFYVNGSNYQGGIAGHANKKDFGYVFANVHVKDGVVTGVDRVGGILGAGSVDNRKHANDTSNHKLATWNNPESEIIVEDMFIVGRDWVGGVVGNGGGVAKNVTVKSSTIYGRSRVGGVIGFGTVLATHCVDSTISSVYDRDIDADGNLNAKNNRYIAALTAKQTTLLEGAGTDSRGTARTKAANLLGVYLSESHTTANKNYGYTSSQLNVSEYRNKPNQGSETVDSYFGGIAGEATVTQCNSVVNCVVGSNTSKNVGGLAGYFCNNGNQVVTYSLNRYVKANSCQNTEVTGSANVGGLIGKLTAEAYGITDNYSNANVKAIYRSDSSSNTGRYAGGIFGYVSGGLNFRGLYFAGTVTADKYWAGGIVGYMNGSYGDATRQLLMLGTVKAEAEYANGSHVLSFIGNTLQGGGNNPTKCYVYEGAKMIDGTTEISAKDYYVTNSNSYTRVVTSADLSNAEFYTNPNGEADKGLFVTTSYWSTSGLANGYMPYVRYNINPTNASGTPVVRYQEGKTGAGYAWKTYKGGVPIPKGTRTTFALRRTVAVKELPEVTAYAVDVDKLNIEFSAVDTTASCIVKANGAVLGEGSIENRTITLQYDFKTKLIVIVTDGTMTEEYEINPVDVSRNVMAYDNEYYYITGTGIEGSRATVYGNFVHLYKGKALAADGSIYDLKQGISVGKSGGIGLTDTVTPLATFTVNGSRIALYQKYSVVNGEVRDGMRLYVEDGTLFAVDGGLTDTADSVLLRVSSQGDELTAVLGNNRKLVDLTSDTVVFPKDFDNSNISQMTNNYQTDSTVVLVRYTDGGVVGFDYRTGDILVETGRSSGAKGTTDGANQDGSNLGVTAPKQYKEVQEFEETLVASGWSQANGSSAANGTSGSETGNTSAFENGSGENGISGISGSNTTSGTNGVAGDSTESGTNTESGENTESGDNGGGTGTESGDNTVSGEDTGAGENGEASGEVSGEDAASGEVSGETATSGEDSGSGDGTEGDAALNGTEAESGKDSGGTKENSGEAASSGNGEDTKYLNEFTDVRNNGNGYASGDRYVPFFDATLNEYVLYDEAELLTASAGTITSVNEKVKRSGHMIDRHIPYVSDLDQADDSNRNGIILMLLTVAGVALLLGILIYKHQNGGKANEED